MAKATSYLPACHHSLGAHLSVQGAAAYMDFLKKAFDAEEMSRAPGPGGKIMHAQMKIGDSVVMLSDDFSEEFHMPPMVRGNLPVTLHLYVPDVDATWAKAVAAGCEVKMPLGDQFWGDRYGHVRDPFGYTWALATHTDDLTPQEIQERQAKAFGGGHP